MSDPPNSLGKRKGELIDRAVARWGLSLDSPPFKDGQFAYVASARMRQAGGNNASGGQGVILKIGHHPVEVRTEAEALRLYDGRGAARLIDYAPDLQAFLIELIEPGAPIFDIDARPETREEQRLNETIGALIQRLVRPAPPGDTFPRFSDWLENFRRKAPAYSGENGPYPVFWLDTALGIAEELTSPGSKSLLLHGDLHHGNVVWCESRPDPPEYLAIDPKGIVGSLAQELGPLFLNALGPCPYGQATASLIFARASQLADVLGLDLKETLGWGIVRLALSSFWGVEDEGESSGWARTLRLADLLLPLYR